MLVDNPLAHGQQPYFSNPTIPSYNDFTDLSEIFHTELFGNPSTSSLSQTNASASASSSASNSSRASSPRSPSNTSESYHSLLTPPPSTLPTSFPDIMESPHGYGYGAGSSSSSFFNFGIEEEKRPMEFDFFGSFASGAGTGTMGTGMGNMALDMSMLMPMPMSSPELTSASTSTTSPPIGIDPQLVGTPLTSKDPSDFGDESSEPGESDDTAQDNDAAKEAKDKEQETTKLTLTISPVKVGGHGKARKGTVQGGGVTKKQASSSSVAASSGAGVQDKENTSVAKSRKAAGTKAKVTPKNDMSMAMGGGMGGSEAGDEEGDGDGADDDLPNDWRPSPEVFQKMTSKERRQLRNKISARNFRVRRKEYISTLEDNIAERDRLLSAIRSELGSSQSENIALRQEVATLKRALLEGRVRTGAGAEEDEGWTLAELNLPPPAPLPVQSAAVMLAASGNSGANGSGSGGLVTPNTQKDLPTSPRLGMSGMGRGFWGGANVGIGGMGGITSVHTAIMPEWAIGGGGGVREKLQENLNPALNAHAKTGGQQQQTHGQQGVLPGGFDGFTELNPFTMKTLDAYRMQLWGKMAAQHHAHQQQQQKEREQHKEHKELTGLASNLRPHYFASSTKHNQNQNVLPSSGSSLSALLSGKATMGANPYPSPPSSPKLLGLDGKPVPGSSYSQQQQREQQLQQRDAVYAALASQTLLQKLGSAFWDAFSGSSSSSSSVPNNGNGAPKSWDADKVRRVLEGKAVVRVVDVEPPVAPVVAPVQRPVVWKSRSLPGSPKLGSASTAAASTSTSAASVPTSTSTSPARSASPPTPAQTKPRAECGACLTSILEESMRSLSLGKKA